MGLNKAPCSVTQTVPVVKSKEIDECKGKILKGTKYACLYQGEFLNIIDVSSGEKITEWRFGATCPGFITDVTCAVELPYNDNSNDIKQVVVGLKCEVMGGMLCILDIQGSRLLRAIRIPGKPLSLSVVDNGSSGCEGRYPLPSLLSSMSGIIAVGVEGGKVFLIDLCRLSCEELLSSWFNDDREEIHDEMNPCQLIEISKDDADPDVLESKRAAAAMSGDHLCLLLNDGAFLQNLFLLIEPGGEVCASFETASVGVTSLLYEPRIASLIVGYSFGCFQLWNLMHLTLNYTSHIMMDPLPVMYVGFQEPSDDPCNFCYLWAVHSSGIDGPPSSSSPVGIMYALSYESKEWVDGYGFLYQDYQSCHFRFEYNLNVDTADDAAGVYCTSFSTLSNMITQRNLSDDGYDEVTSENDFSLCVFAWEAYDTNNKPISTHLALFDLNQWYKDQMPIRVNDSEDESPGFLVTFSLNSMRENGGNSSVEMLPLLDIKVDSQNLAQFKSFESQEEHYHPSALSFVSHCLLEDRIVSITHPGLQKYILCFMEKEGSLCLLRPTSLFKHCLMVGLKPVLIDINNLCDVPAVVQRDYLLSVALENQMLGFLYRCASDWANGSVSGVDCTLPMLLSWGYQRAVTLKETAYELCVHLFDHTGICLDKNERRLLDNCAIQLRQLATLFDGILNDCRLLSLLNMDEFKDKTSEVLLVAQYFEVLLWFLNVGLLPEFPENGCNQEERNYNDPSCIQMAYPVSSVEKIYQSRRQEFKTINVKNGTSASLYIDQLLQNETNGSQLSELWQSDGGTGMYPPPSIQSLLAMYLQDGIDIQTKNSIVIYVFLDLASILDNEKYSSIIEYFVKFPSAFCMTPSIIKVTQAFWLLDQKYFEDALDMVLDPLVSAQDVQPWQHKFIVHSLLSQNQHTKALEYFTLRQLPIQGIEDIQLKTTLLVKNKQVTQAYNFLQQYYNEENNRELLLHFFQECDKIHQLGTILKLMLSPEEEELFMTYLQNFKETQSEDMQVVFYLMRSRIIEAVAVNERINFSNSRKVNSVRRPRHNPTIRNVLVDGYAKTLPDVTRQLANYCSQQKKSLSAWRQVQRPTPMSVEIHYGTKKSVAYKSSLIHATLEKARETWMMPVLSTYSSDSTLKESMDITTMKNLPFLCTSHDSLKHERETTPVVFPSMRSNSVKRTYDDDGSSYTPLKRSRLENSQSVESILLSHKTKEFNSATENNNSLLLKSPLVKRITPLRLDRGKLKTNKNDIKPVESFTPQSILKVRHFDRCSVTPERLPSDNDSDPDLDENLNQEIDDRPTYNRQIRFSLPMPPEEEHPLSSSTPSSINIKPSKGPLGVSPRLPLKSSLALLRKNNTEIVEKYISGGTPDNTDLQNLEKRSQRSEESPQQNLYLFGSGSVQSINDKSLPDKCLEGLDTRELNTSQGDDSFYSAGSASNSYTSQDKQGKQEEKELSIHKSNAHVCNIKSRRQLSRTKVEFHTQAAETLSETCTRKVVDWKIEDCGKEHSSSSEGENESEIAHSETTEKSVLGDTFVDLWQNKSLMNPKTNKVSSDLESQGIERHSFHQVRRENAESSFVKVPEIKARRPLSRLSNLGNDDSIHTSASEFEKSHNLTKENSDILGSSSVIYEEILIDLDKNRKSALDEDKVMEVTNDSNKNKVVSVLEHQIDDKFSHGDDICCSNQIFPEESNKANLFTVSESSSFVNREAKTDVSSYDECESKKTVLYPLDKDLLEKNEIADEEKTYTSLTAVSVSSYDHVLSTTNINECQYEEINAQKETELEMFPTEVSYSLDSEIHEPYQILGSSTHKFNSVADTPFTLSDPVLNKDNANIFLTHEAIASTRPHSLGMLHVESENTSGMVIELDSDKSDGSYQESHQLSKQEGIRIVEEVSAISCKQKEDAEVIVVDSDTDSGNVVATLEKEDDNPDVIEIIESQQRSHDQQKENIDDPDNALWSQELKEEPIILRVSDSEDESENVNDDIKESGVCSSINSTLFHQTSDQLFHDKADSTPQKLPSFNTLANRERSERNLLSSLVDKSENEFVNDTSGFLPDQFKNKDNVLSDNVKLVIERDDASISRSTEVHECKNTEQDMIVVLSGDSNLKTKKITGSSSVQSEPPCMSDVIDSELGISKQPLTKPSSIQSEPPDLTDVVSEKNPETLVHSGVITRQRRRRISIHIDSPIVAEEIEGTVNNVEDLKGADTPRTRQRRQQSLIEAESLQTDDTLETSQRIGTPGSLTRQRRRRSSVQCDSPSIIIKNDDLIELEKMGTPRSRQRRRPSSVQSEPPLLNDVLESEHLIENSILTRQSRNSGSLQLFPAVHDEVDFEYDNILARTCTPRSGRKGRSSSVQSEPALLDDVMEVEQPENYSVLTRQRRRNSLQADSPVTSNLGKSIQNLETLEEKVTPVRRQRRSSSVQSEPPQLGDVLETNNSPENKRIGSGMRRRSSIHCETNVEGGNEKNNDSLKKSSTPRRKPGSLHSLQTEPPSSFGLLTPQNLAAQNEDTFPNLSDSAVNEQRHGADKQSITGCSESEAFLQSTHNNKSSSVNDESSIDIAHDIAEINVTSSQRTQKNSIPSISCDESVSKSIKENKLNRCCSEEPAVTSDTQREEILYDSSHKSEFVDEISAFSHKCSNARSMTNQDKLIHRVLTNKHPRKLRSSSESEIHSPGNDSKTPLLKQRDIISQGDELPSTSCGANQTLKMNLRSRRSQSAEKEISSIKKDSENVEEPVSDSDSVQSEPPISDHYLTRQTRSCRTKKGSSGKKSHKVTYYLRFPPKLSALKEEPEIEASGVDGALTDEKTLDNAFGESKQSRYFRRRRQCSETEGSNAADSSDPPAGHYALRKKSDSVSSISSKSTIILEQVGKRKRSTSPSSPEKHEAKKFILKNEEFTESTGEEESEGFKRENENPDETMEKYATARRLTRYQRNLMERTIDSTKGILTEYSTSQRTPEKNADDSDNASVASGYTTGSSQIRYSTRLQEKRIMAAERSPSVSSQISVSPRKTVSGHHHEESSASSPGSVRSGRSSVASSSQWPSPGSTSSLQAVKCAQKASKALFSSERGKKSTRSNASETSEAGSVSGSEGAKNPSQDTMNTDCVSQSGSLRSHSSSRSKSSRTSSKKGSNSRNSKRTVEVRKNDLERVEEEKAEKINENLHLLTEKDKETIDDPPATMSQEMNLPNEDVQDRPKPEGHKVYYAFKTRKYFKLNHKKKK